MSHAMNVALRPVLGARDLACEPAASDELIKSLWQHQPAKALDLLVERDAEVLHAWAQRARARLALRREPDLLVEDALAVVAREGLLGHPDLRLALRRALWGSIRFQHRRAVQAAAASRALAAREW
jgi:hypothetical protein